MFIKVKRLDFLFVFVVFLLDISFVEEDDICLV